MEGIQIVTFAPLLAVILCVSVGNCCLSRGLRNTIQNLEQRLTTLETNRQTPHVILAPPPPLQRPPLLQQQPPSYYYQQPPYPSAPRTLYTV